MKWLAQFSFLILPIFSIGQTDYSKVDSLIASKSSIDAMMALDLLKEEFLSDTISADYWLRFSNASNLFYDREMAKTCIAKSIQLSPERADIFFAKGRLHIDDDELELAFEAFDKAVKLEKNGEFVFFRGIINHQTGQPENAKSDYLSALKWGHNAPEVYSNLAILLAESEEYESSLEYLNQMIKLNPKFPKAYSIRAKVYLYRINVDSSCRDIRKAQELGVKNTLVIPDSVCNGTKYKQIEYAAEFLALNDQYTRCIEAYSRLIEANQLNGAYFLNRGYCHFQLNNYLDAENDYLRALEFKDASKDQLYDNLALLYFNQNKLNKSIEFTNKRIQLDTLNPTPYIDRGLCHRKLKNYQQAEADFNHALQINPFFFRALAYRSYLYSELGNAGKALEDAQKAVKLNPEYAYGYLVLAKAKILSNVSGFCLDLQKAISLGNEEAREILKTFCQ